MQNQKVHINRKKFRIGDLAQELKVKKFVIRFWEKEFKLKSDRSDGGQRFYNEDDFKTFSLIKELLYEKKFTIPGAKQELENIFINTKNNSLEEFSEEPFHQSITQAQNIENNITPATSNILEEIDLEIKSKPKEKLNQKEEYLSEKLFLIKQKLMEIKAKLD